MCDIQMLTQETKKVSFTLRPTLSQLYTLSKVYIFAFHSSFKHAFFKLCKAMLAELLQRKKGGGSTGSALTGREGPWVENTWKDDSVIWEF